MAVPVEFPEQNCVFTAPPGVPPEECGDLPALRGNERIVSAWRLSPEEIARVVETGIVWHTVWGERPFPVYVGGLQEDVIV